MISEKKCEYPENARKDCRDVDNIRASLKNEVSYENEIVVMLTGVFAASMLLSGCEASKGLETDNLTITQYKGVEVDEVDKPEEVTDEDVEAAIQANLQTQATTEEVTGRAVESGDTVTIDYTGKMTESSLRAAPVRIIRW